MKVTLPSLLILMALCLIKASGANAQATQKEVFTPFKMIQQTVEGRQLLDIADNAEYEPEMSKQQLDVLAKTGIKAKHIEYEVAQYLAYISVHNALSEFDKTSAYLSKLHVLGVKLGNEWILSLYYHKKARLALKQGEYLNGLDFASQALTLADSIHFKEASARAKSVRAIFYGKLGKSTLALKDYQDALTVFDELNHKTLSMKIYLNMVALYLDRQEYDKALIASDNVINILEALPRKNIRAMAANYINRAIALSYLGKVEQELDAYNTALTYAIRSNDIEILATIYANLSDYYLRNNNYTNAEKQANLCIETANRINNIHIVSVCQLNLGLTYVYLDKREAGFTLLNQALATIQKERIKSNLPDAYLAFSTAYQYLNDHKSANSWIEKRYQHLLEQTKEDQALYYSAVEQDFHDSVADRDNIYTSVKKDMLTNILTQDQLVKKLIIILIIISTLLLLFVSLTIYYRRKLAKYH